MMLAVCLHNGCGFHVSSPSYSYGERRIVDHVQTTGHVVIVGEGHTRVERDDDVVITVAIG